MAAKVAVLARIMTAENLAVEKGLTAVEIRITEI